MQVSPLSTLTQPQLFQHGGLPLMSAKSHMSTLSCPLALTEAEGENGHIKYDEED